MATAIKAIYEHGVFRPVAPVRLKEATEVDVLVPTEVAEDDDDPTGWKAIDALIGIGQAVAPDVSEKHDDYLYNDPHV
ncbi:MAG: antitoxin family protein [Anaerolineae bacterium]|nr:antitoxin family protein [Anaerolineae bacterium]